MTLLLLGLALWWGAHFLKRVAPEARARMGRRAPAILAVVLVVSVVLMVIGYRGASGPVWWGRTPATVAINNILMLIAFYIYLGSGLKTWVARKFRHPQLLGFSLWAVAHLLVNGDLPSFVLFGGLLVWALTEIVVINRAERVWTPVDPVPASKEVQAAVATLLAFGVVAGIHTWLGYNPFG